MHNSFIAAIFSVTIALIAIGYASGITIYNRSIQNSSEDLQRLNFDTELINEIIDRVNKGEEISDLQRASLEIEIEDISSKINLNFVDFTIFKEPELKTLLKPGYSWLDLESFRNEIGFTMNKELYRDFFDDDIEFDELFTLYGLPNINNSSDIMIERYYAESTGDNSRASNLKSEIENLRIAKKILDEDSFRNFTGRYNRDAMESFTTIPSWNTHNVEPKLLNMVVRRYKLNNIDMGLIKRGNYTGHQSYLGNKTTFWKVTITGEITTEIILKWEHQKELYKLIRLKRSGI